MAVEAVNEPKKTHKKNMSAPNCNNTSLNLKNQNFKTMPKSKKLQPQIENKLDQLSKLLNKINEAQVINSEDPET